MYMAYATFVSLSRQLLLITPAAPNTVRNVAYGIRH